jgi:hypothetical protein
MAISREDVDDLKRHIDGRVNEVHTRIQSLERHVTGGSEPERSLLVRQRDIEKDVQVLKTAHSRVTNLLITAGLGAIISIGAAIKAVASVISSGK